VSLRRVGVFVFPFVQLGSAEPAVWTLANVCVRACVFGLVRLSVYVCVPRRGSVHKNFPVISFPCLPKKHMWLAEDSEVEFMTSYD
jgi:hypothetical protein